MVQIQTGRRLTWLSVIILMMLSALGGRLYYFQIVKSAEYTAIAHSQQTLSLPLASKRGPILDRNGESLTDPTTQWSVAVFPSLVTDRAGEGRALAVALNQSEAQVVAALSARQPAWIDRELGLRLTPAQVTAVQEMGLPGITVAPVQQRIGPDPLARHLVGYVNEKGGQQGLERAFDKELTGDAVPALTAYLDGKGQPIAGLGMRATVPTVGKPPDAVVTTIDRRIQEAVETVLDSHRAPDGGVLSAAAVVVDPRSGDVLAMASRPNFAYDTLDPTRSTALADRAAAAYPPGSVFKAVIAAAALEQGLVKLDERFYTPGYYQLDKIRFADGCKEGWFTFREAMARSCNSIFLKVGVERLGVTAMRDWAVKFGFGTPTGLLGRPWPEEAAGTVPSASDDSAIQLAFGQGSLEVTPLQIARAYSALANGGTLPALRLVTAVKSPAGEVMDRPAAGHGQRIMSEETAAFVQQALQAVTDPNGVGTGKSAWISGAGSAGKTGSAETGQTGPDGKQIVHAWFAGYFPTWQPKYVVVVFVENGQAGGAVAAPIFREIGKSILAISGY